MADSQSQDSAAGPHCLHVVGIGRSGVGYIDGLLRTGEVEDLVRDNEGARVACLAIDVGEDDLLRAEGYADALSDRMEEQGIPADRFNYQSISLDAPSSEELVAAAGNGKSYLPESVAAPAAGDHMSRAVAKAVYAHASSGVLGDALSNFAAQVQGAALPSRVMLCFNLAGGTGSGMAPDLARDLAGKLGGDVPIIGVGQMPHSGDGDAPASLYASLSEFASMTDDAKNADAGGSGNPFSGGFVVVNTEHSWQRLTSYTTTGEPGIRDRIRQEVVNKFAQDSFMRFAMRDIDGALNQALAASGLTGDASVAGQRNSWVLYNLAKFTHPGVQVLPGEAISKWHSVTDQWVGYLDRYSGVGEDFRAGCAVVHVHSPRTIGFERLNAAIESKLAENFVKSGDASDIQTANHEFFDHLTAYADIVLPGLAASDLTACGAAKDAYEGLGAAEKKACHSWLLEKGVTVTA